MLGSESNDPTNDKSAHYLTDISNKLKDDLRLSEEDTVVYQFIKWVVSVQRDLPSSMQLL